MSDSFVGFLEEMKRREIVASSFVSQPQNDVSGFCLQPSQLDSSVDSTYSAFANNLGAAGASSPIVQRHEERARRLGELMELSLSDDDELWDEIDQLQKEGCDSECKWMSVGEFGRRKDAQSTILGEEGQRTNGNRNWRLVESGNEKSEGDGGKSWCPGQLAEGDKDKTIVSGQDFVTSVGTRIANSKSRESLQNEKIPKERQDFEDTPPKIPDKKRFPCVGCPKLFTTKHHATNHSFTHMSKEELDKLQVFYEECSTCTKIFFHKGNFKKHQLIHSGIKHHICGVCGMSFTQKANLAKHANVHLNPQEKEEVKSGWKNVCYFCDKKFPTPSDLLRHFPTHSKEKAFRCQLCRQTFAQQGSLTSHKKNVHEQRAQFICEDCGSSFGTKGTLKDHSVVHSRTRPFPCPKCDKTFAQNYNLSVHLKSAHFGVRYKCTKCSKSFSNSSNLKRHLKAVHK